MVQQTLPILEYTFHLNDMFLSETFSFVPGTMSREVTLEKNTQSAHCMHV